MLRGYISEYTLTMLTVLLCLYAVVKLFLINMYGLRDDPFKLFLDSFRIYSKQVVKNTFFKNLQKYYITSNRVNYGFYTILALLGVLYLVFSK